MTRINYQDRHLENILHDIIRNYGSEITIEELAALLDEKGVIAPKFKVYEKAVLSPRSKNEENISVYIKNIKRVLGSGSLCYSVSVHADKSDSFGILESRLFKNTETIPEYNCPSWLDFEEYEANRCENNKDKLTVILSKIYAVSEISDKEILSHKSVLSTDLLHEGVCVSKFNFNQEVFIIDRFNPEENRSSCEYDNEKLTEYKIREFYITQIIFNSRFGAPLYVVCPKNIEEKEQNSLSRLYWDRIFTEKEIFTSFEDAEKMLEMMKGEKR